MKILISMILVFLSTTSFSKEIQYKGAISFKAETNMPGVNIEGDSKTFKSLKANFSDDGLSLLKIDAEIDAETLKTGIEMRDHHMFEKIFLVLSANEKPVILKMMMNKADCSKKSNDLVCVGVASFALGKKTINRKLELKFDKNLNTESVFNLSLKELGIEVPSYLGVELEDTVALKMQVTL